MVHKLLIFFFFFFFLALGKSQLICCYQVCLGGGDFRGGSAEGRNRLPEGNLEDQAEAGVPEGRSGPSAVSRKDQGGI